MVRRGAPFPRRSRPTAVPADSGPAAPAPAGRPAPRRSVGTTGDAAPSCVVYFYEDRPSMRTGGTTWQSQRQLEDLIDQGEAALLVVGEGKLEEALARPS